jgi:bifunctional non-homologous end joining protein LigD
LRYYVFDLLNIENRDLKQLSIERRKAILETLLQNVSPPILYSANLKGKADVLLEKARKNKIEGIVGKRVDSVYEPGRRSGAWVKIKISLEQEFVIGGYTEPGGSRPHFGSVLVGYYEAGKLMFSARVGTGFDTKLLKTLYTGFQKIRTETCPFSNVPSQRHGRFGTGLTRAEMKRCTWLKPVLVCQVRFTEWTDDGGLRHPVFLGLRDDITPEEVRREVPAEVR